MSKLDPAWPWDEDTLTARQKLQGLLIQYWSYLKLLTLLEEEISELSAEIKRRKRRGSH